MNGSFDELTAERYKEYDFLGNNSFLELVNELKKSPAVKDLIAQIDDVHRPADNKCTEDIVDIIFKYELYRQVYKNKKFDKTNRNKMRMFFKASNKGLSELAHVYRTIKSSEGYSVAYGRTPADRSKGLGFEDLCVPGCFSLGDLEENVFKFVKTKEKGKKRIDETEIGEITQIQGCLITNNDDPHEISEIRIYYVEKELYSVEKSQANTLKACKYKHNPYIFYPELDENQDASEERPTCPNIKYYVLDCDNKIGKNELELIVDYKYEQIIKEYGINKEKVAKTIKYLFGKKLKNFKIDVNIPKKDPKVLKEDPESPMYG